MGYLSHGQCFKTALEAATDICSKISFGPNWSNVLIFCRDVSVINNNIGRMILDQHNLGGSNIWVRQLDFPLLSCDYETTVHDSIGQVPFDYLYASGLWGLAFTFVLGLYLISKNAGLILALIRGH